MTKRRTDGWEELTIVVTADVAEELASIGRDRLEGFDADDRAGLRRVCDAKGWVLADVVTGLGVTELIRRSKR